MIDIDRYGIDVSGSPQLQKLVQTRLPITMNMIRGLAQCGIKQNGAHPQSRQTGTAPDNYYTDQHNLDDMSVILRAHEHPIYFNVTLPTAWLAAEMIARRMEPGRGAHMLEIGSGDGLTTSILYKTMQEVNNIPVSSYACLDPFATALTTTRSKVEQEFPYDSHRFSYWETELQNPALLDRFAPPIEGFDGIVGIFSINYSRSSAELRQSLANIRAMLAKNGLAVLLGNFYNPTDWNGGRVVDQREYGVTFRMKKMGIAQEPHAITVQLNSVQDPQYKSDEFTNYIVTSERFGHLAREAGLYPVFVNAKNVFNNPAIARLSPICRIVTLTRFERE